MPRASAGTASLRASSVENDLIRRALALNLSFRRTEFARIAVLFLLNEHDIEDGRQQRSIARGTASFARIARIQHIPFFFFFFGFV
jgi:hypothetical protein